MPDSCFPLCFKYGEGLCANGAGLVAKDKSWNARLTALVRTQGAWPQRVLGLWQVGHKPIHLWCAAGGTRSRCWSCVLARAPGAGKEFLHTGRRVQKRSIQRPFVRKHSWKANNLLGLSLRCAAGFSFLLRAISLGDEMQARMAPATHADQKQISSFV